MTDRIAYMFATGGMHGPALFPGLNAGSLLPWDTLHPSAPSLRALLDSPDVGVCVLLNTGNIGAEGSHFQNIRARQDRGTYAALTGQGHGDKALANTFAQDTITAVTVGDSIQQRILEGGAAKTYAVSVNSAATDAQAFAALIEQAGKMDDLPEFQRDIYVNEMSAIGQAAGFNLGFAGKGQAMAEMLAENPAVKMVTGWSTGFDNHTDFKNQFARALGQLDTMIGAFAQGVGWLSPGDPMGTQFTGRTVDTLDDTNDDVILVIDSEFSRDINLTSGGGYSHGRGGLTIVIGRRVKQGFVGQKMPTLEHDTERCIFVGDSPRFLPIEIPTPAIWLAIYRYAGWNTTGLFSQPYTPVEGIFLDPLPAAKGLEWEVIEGAQPYNPDPTPEPPMELTPAEKLIADIKALIEAYENA